MTERTALTARDLPVAPWGPPGPDVALSAVVQLAATGGWTAVTLREVARLAAVRTTVVRHRWPDRSLLAVEVVESVTLLPPPVDHGSTAADLGAVLDGLGLPLRPGELAVAGLLGDRGWPPALGVVVAAALDRAPRSLLSELGRRAADRGEHVQLGGPVQRTLRALLVARLVAGPLDPVTVGRQAAGVLLPALTEARGGSV